MPRFILLNKDNKPLINQLKSFFNISKETIIDNNLVIYLDSDIDDLLHTINALFIDLFSKERIYISGNKKELDDELSLVSKYYDLLPNDICLAPDLVKIVDDKELALKVILGKYYNDLAFKEVINRYFINNLNVLPTANSLYLHRNTLLYKLNSFYDYTGFNLKEFKDSAILYNYYID